MGSVLNSINNEKVEVSEWQKFDEMRIEKEVSQGKIVFVDVSAKWCITCKANKKFVLNTQIIKEKLSDDDIVVMQADWTGRDENISKYLTRYNRYGVPFNIIYSQKYPEGLILQEILSKEIVLKVLRKVK